jgi:hypothetical protein
MFSHLETLQQNEFMVDNILKLSVACRGEKIQHKLKVFEDSPGDFANIKTVYDSYMFFKFHGNFPY